MSTGGTISSRTNQMSDRQRVFKLAMGILQNIDNGLFTKKELDVRAKDLILNESDYWLSYALAALIYWFMDERSNAEETLSRALELDDRKTSLFFALVCIKYKRLEAADLWIERYMLHNTAYEVHGDFIWLLNAMGMRMLSSKASEYISSKIKEWETVLSADSDLENNATAYWNGYMHEIISSETLPDILDFHQLKVLPPEGADNTASALLHGAKLHKSLRERLSKISGGESGNVRADNQVNGWILEFLKTDVEDEDNDDVCGSYTEFLTGFADWIIHDKPFNLVPAVRNFIIASSVRWIRNAYEDVSGEINALVPYRVPFVLNFQFRKKTYHFNYFITNGLDELKVKKEYEKFMEPIIKDALKEAPWIRPAITSDGIILALAALIYFGASWVFTYHMMAACVGVLIISILLLGLWMGIISGAILLTAAYYLTRYLHENMHMFMGVLGFILLAIPCLCYSSAMGLRKLIQSELDRVNRSNYDYLEEAMAEMADFRDYFKKYSREGRETRKFLNDLSARDYLSFDHKIHRI